MVVIRQLYITDPHFGHEQSIEYNSRPFNNVDEMDREMIYMWNDVCCRSDHIFIGGDVCYRNEKPAYWYVEQLKGHLHLIIGNHDVDWIMKDERAMRRFVSVDKMRHISDNKRHICMCHFPLAEWNGYYRGHWHVFGHVHNRIDRSARFMAESEKALNAGADIIGYKPCTFDDLIRYNIEFKEKNNLI